MVDKHRARVSVSPVLKNLTGLPCANQRKTGLIKTGAKVIRDSRLIEPGGRQALFGFSHLR